MSAKAFWIIITLLAFAPTLFAVSNPIYSLKTSITAGETGWGIITPAAGTHSYTSGSLVTITATPSKGYTFTGWKGTGKGSYTGTSPTEKLTLKGDITETATFKLIPDSLKMSITTGEIGWGTVTPAVGVHSYTSGSTVTITATPSKGYLFVGWKGTGAGSYTGKSLTTKLKITTAGITETATFGPTNYSLTTSLSKTGCCGAISPKSGKHSYKIGTSVTITATPDKGYTFVGWKGIGPGSYTGNSLTTKLKITTGSITETATFKPIFYYLTMTANSIEGSISPSNGIHSYIEGYVTTITATPNPDYSFVGWNGIGTGSYSGNSLTKQLVINGNIIEIANFAPMPSTAYSLTMASNSIEGNTIPDSPGTYNNLAPGNVLEIVALPNNGYVFTNWTSSTSNILIANTLAYYTTAVIDGNGTVTANFKATSVVSSGQFITIATDPVEIEAIAASKNGSVYWTDVSGNVFECPASTFSDSCSTTRNPILIATHQSGPTAISVDNGNVYWTEFDNGTFEMPNGEIGNANVIKLALDLNNWTEGLATNDGNVYWYDYRNSGTIRELPSGKVGISNAITLYSDVGENPGHIAVNSSGNVYFTNLMNVTEMPSAESGNANAITISPPAYNPQYITTYASNVYWTTYFGEVVEMPNGESGNANSIVLYPESYPYLPDGGIAVSDGNIYWSTGNVMEMPSTESGSSNAITIATGQGYLITAQGSNLYWIGPGDNITEYT